jgi:DNA replication protein DnaC
MFKTGLLPIPHVEALKTAEHCVDASKVTHQHLRGAAGGCGSIADTGHTWLLQADNLLLFRPSGVGKTHIASGIALALIGLDQPCRFYPATALVQELQKARSGYALPAALQRLDRYPLLLIDDVGYVRRDEHESAVLFELICHRYERRSILITSNQPFSAWEEIFPSSSMTVAAVDRLVHHCRIVEITGDSHRRAQAASRAQAKSQGKG